MFRFFIFIHSFRPTTGKICTGSCCSQTAETELIGRASNNFDRMLRHHTRNLRSNLEATAKTFQSKYDYDDDDDFFPVVVLFMFIRHRLSFLCFCRPQLDWIKKSRKCCIEAAK